jgi:NADH-quinone oxidoreductase subunit H
MAPGCQPADYFAGMNLWEEWVRNFFPRMAHGICRALGGDVPGGLPDWVIFLVLSILGSIIVVTIAAVGVLYIVLAERKLLGRFQHRWGPNRVGKFGLLQPIADALKLMTKEDVTPRAADAVVFTIAPILFAGAVIATFAVIPWSKDAALSDLDAGLLYAVAISTAGEMAVFMAGWASNNRYSLFGAMRSVAMLISYEFPLVLSIGAIALLAGTLSLGGIAEAQQNLPFILFQPLGFLIFFTAISAELNRPPFDLMEAESELITGFHTEYSGMKWAVVQLGEYAGIVAFSAIGATLFLGGYQGWILPGYVWLAIKTLLIIGLFVWVRATLPRLRVDQIMGLGWKFLLPLALFNLLVAAVQVLAYPDGLPLWLVPVNFGVAVSAIFWGAKLLKFRGETRQVIKPGRAVITPTTGFTPAVTPAQEARR